MENPNVDASIAFAGYEVNLYEASSSLSVKMIEDKTYVPANSLFAVFIGPFTLPVGVNPTRASFAWRPATLVWKQDKTLNPDLKVRDRVLTSATSSPRLEAIIENPTLNKVSNIELVALMKDESGNIFAASKTYLDTLAGSESMPVVFTWPRPFEKTPIDTPIIIRIFPNSSYIR
jgi:hypothetical protein